MDRSNYNNAENSPFRHCLGSFLTFQLILKIAGILNTAVYLPAIPTQFKIRPNLKLSYFRKTGIIKIKRREWNKQVPAQELS